MTHWEPQPEEIRACGLCDATGRRLETIAQPDAQPCTHRPLLQMVDRLGAIELVRLRRAAEGHPDPCPDCGQPAGETCVDATGQPLRPRSPAHVARLARARRATLAARAAG